MPIAGGIHLSLYRGKKANCSVVQIFTKNQMQWKSPPLRDREVEIFLKEKKNFFEVFAHSSYLLNLASPDDNLFKKSINSLAEDIKRCEKLGISMLVLHPGSHRGKGEKFGIERLATGLIETYQIVGNEKVSILLETMAGQGYTLGYKFEHLRDIIEKTGKLEKTLGVCLDTCHIFAAGYNFRDETNYARLKAQIKKTVGLNRIRAIHLNDSKTELGSNRDRHQHIGKGEIGPIGFKLIVTDPDFRNIPMNLETPKGKDFREDKENLRVLRTLRSSGLINTKKPENPQVSGLHLLGESNPCCRDENPVS